MGRELFTNWTDCQTGVDRLLAMARQEILIWDHDLLNLKLDGAERLDALRALLATRPRDCLRIALQDSGPMVKRQPQVIALLANYHHTMAIQQVPEQLADLRDSMLLVDGKHGLIRFERDQPRCKLLIDEKEELMPYFNRFEEIWRSGGTPVSATTLGL